MTRSILASIGDRAMPLILAVMLLVIIATQFVGGALVLAGGGLWALSKLEGKS